MTGLIEGSLNKPGLLPLQLVKAIVEQVTHVGIPCRRRIAAKYHAYQTIASTSGRGHQIEA